jgi:hypothetical protein
VTVARFLFDVVVVALVVCGRIRWLRRRHRDIGAATWWPDGLRLSRARVTLQSWGIHGSVSVSRLLVSGAHSAGETKRAITFF